MWFSKSYRRHLCDMHIEDWDEMLLSQFSPETYVDNLKKAKIQSAMIYFQSHAGICNYPTKNGDMHKALVGREDLIKRTVDLCRQNGIDVIGYYSLIYNTREHDKHPDWKMVDKNGKSRRDYGFEKTNLTVNEALSARYGHCCPNNPDYRQFVVDQIKEMSEYFTVEGMFYDMPFWPYECHCEHCKKRFAEEVGGEIPSPNLGDERYLKFLQKRRDWMGEFTRLTYEATKKYFGKDVSVEQNFAQGALEVNMGCAEEVNANCDYAGGDLYGSPYNHSFTCKFYKNITRNQPYEYMFSRCENLRKHTLTKSKDVMLSSAFNTLAHHGATLVIDAIDLTGTLDERVYSQIGEVFSQTEKYEDKMQGDMIEDIGLYFSQVGKYTPSNIPFTNHAGTVNVAQGFVKAHIPHGITGHFHALDGYKIIVASALTSDDRIDNERLVKYVENGGKLYFSSWDNRELLKELMGVTVTGVTRESANYISPTDKMGKFGIFTAKYPLAYDGACPEISGYENCDVLATLTKPLTVQTELTYASIHSNPPGVYTDMPVILRKKFGKGEVIWSALPFEAQNGYHYQELFCEFIVDAFSYASPVKTDAPYDVEVVTYRTQKGYQLNTTQIFEEGRARKLYDFDVLFKTEKEPKRVVRVSDGAEMKVKYSDGFTAIYVDKMDIFEMYEIDM